MNVRVVITPKIEVDVKCVRFKEMNGTLLFYSDSRMTKLLCGYKKWIRFYATVPVKASKPVKASEEDK